MNRSMNRIKEILEGRDIKQIWFSEKSGKSFSITNFHVCDCRNHALRPFSGL